MRLIAPLLPVEVHGRIAGIIAWRRRGPVLSLKALVARPRFDQRSIHAEVLVRKQVGGPCLLQYLRKELPGDVARRLKRLGSDVAYFSLDGPLGAEAELVRRVAEEWLSQKRRSDFEKLHLAVQRQAIQIQLLKLGVAPDFDLTEQLRGSANQPVPIGPGLTVRRERGGRVVKEATVCPTFRPEQIAVELKGADGAVDFGRLRIYWRLRSRKASVNRRPKFAKGCEYFNAERIGSPVVLRHWRAGDRFQPIGMKAPVKLQDLFVNRKISRAQRHQLVVATTAAGELFWVEGVRIGERFKLDNRTVYLLKWRWLVR